MRGMQELRSHVGGSWAAGTGAQQTLLNPTTEEPLAQASSEGVDLKAALDYARTIGGPALRAHELRRARRRAQGHRRCDARRARCAARARHRQRRQYPLGCKVRCRWSDCDVTRLLRLRNLFGREEVPAGRRRNPARTLGALPWPAHLGAAPRRGGAHQRVQFPGLGVRGEGGGRAARRHAGAQQAGHQLGDGRAPHHAAHRREEAAARRRAFVPGRRGARSRRAPRPAGRGGVHRLGRNGHANPRRCPA